MFTGRPLSAPKRGTIQQPAGSGWNGRHCIAQSRHNPSLTKTARVYFDMLPNLDSHGEVLPVRMLTPQYRLDEGLMEVKECRQSSSIGQFSGGALFNRKHETRGQRSRSERCASASGRRSSASGVEAAAPTRGGGTKLSLVSPFGDWDDPKMSTCKEFVSWCSERFTHLVSLWCKLDKDRKMELSRDEFIQGMHDLDYGGDLEELWSIFDRDISGSISFLKFAPDEALELAQFKQWVASKFGSAAFALLNMDTDGGGQLNFVEFTNFCSKYGFPSHLKGSLEILYQVLIGHVGDSNGEAAIELSFIDAWDPPGFLFVSPDHHAKLRFKRGVVTKCRNNPLLAWWSVLDRDGFMCVNCENFLLACDELADLGVGEACWEKELLIAVYCSLDGRRCGWFSLKDWDRECYHLLADFTLWAKETFGSVAKLVESFGDAFGALGLEEFVKCTKQTGLALDALELIFEALVGDRKGSLENKKLSVDDVEFLERWDPLKEQRDGILWESVVNKRIDAQVRRNIADAQVQKVYGRLPGSSRRDPRHPSDGRQSMPAAADVIRRTPRTLHKVSRPTAVRLPPHFG